MAKKKFYHIVWPELVFGIAGPIGIKIDEVCESLSESLKHVGYESHLIKITDEIKDLDSYVEKPKSPSFYEQMKYKMAHASALCKSSENSSVLMHHALKAIKRQRGKSTQDVLPMVAMEPIYDLEKMLSRYEEAADEEKTIILKHKTAYIIRQIKRPDEVEFLRSVYGRQFVLISAYGSEEDRRVILEEKLKQSLPVSIPDLEVKMQVEDLLIRDMHEGNDEYGQHLRDSYYLADVFVDGIDKAKLDSGLERFIKALFGAADIAPTKEEFGLYMAGAASLRSSDLSRQVGAAIFRSSGELIAQGCNEVPKAFGGTYWDTEQPDFRDIKVGHDPNDLKKSEVVRDLIERLESADLLSEKAKALAPDIQGLVQALTGKKVAEDGSGSLKDAVALDITEYGRVVHAEMNAICEASRLGHAVSEAILFCTTFPCHNCTKHILAAGIKKVIYLEPYPKSKAHELHKNEISIESEEAGKVSFMPFNGIAPGLFRHVFTKGKRKSDGKALRWISESGARPMVEVTLPSYVLFEDAVVGAFNE